MKNEIISNHIDFTVNKDLRSVGYSETVYASITPKSNNYFAKHNHSNELAEILVISSFPPRECGIATYSQDLIKALNNKFSNSLSIKICALESGISNFDYPDDVKYILDTSRVASFEKLSKSINQDKDIQIVLIQHEFGLYMEQEQAFLKFLYELTKPVVIVFHTVLPRPDEQLKAKVKHITAVCRSIIVMTNTSADILKTDYGVSKQKISVIAHGTHLVPHLNKKSLKEKYGLVGKKVLSTFGLLSSGKSIETTIKALPAIVKTSPDVVFLVLGKTHPEVVKHDGERYRESLEQLVTDLDLKDNVVFVNKYLSLPVLLEYLQLTDIYLFTSSDPNQAVSGTFAYAMSCACPIISTPIPHAKEVLAEDTGIIFDFRNSQQLADAVIKLLNDEPLRKQISNNTLQKIISTAWENSAVAHAMLLEKIGVGKIKLEYDLPTINLDHLREMTTEVGMIQFSKNNQPDISTGYTLDDNARAMVALCMHLKIKGDKESINHIRKYLNFIKLCQQPGGDFLNYVDKVIQFTDQNKEVNLDDSNGRAVWALGYLLSIKKLLPSEIVLDAETILEKSLPHVGTISSPRAMAFAIKGIYFAQKDNRSPDYLDLIKSFADRLLQMYKHESNEKWEWYEGYLTYANSILPEAMLFAWMMTGEPIYKDIAKTSFNFLLSLTFNENGIQVISNKSWLQKGQEAAKFGEQPIDVAYTIMTLSKFYNVFKNEDYHLKMMTAFNWFLGNNRLHQIVYNPCTGGCYDGLEETHVNLNQGAESTVSYLMARLTIEKHKNEK
ncbi:MAG TPA: glycosyltransferase [Paludibacter sp.]